MNSESMASRRLEALRAYAILDADRETQFDALTTLASEICDTPIAMISLLDTNRQWFLSRVGIEDRETPLNQSFCLHAVAKETTEVFVVPDATQDPLFANNPLVTGNPAIRLYAGAPLLTPSNVSIGTICVIDDEPRILTSSQIESLKLLARQAIHLLESRRVSRELAAIVSELKILEGYWNLCVYCRRLKAEEAWVQLENFIAKHTNATFTHGVCPECLGHQMSKEDLKQ